MNDQNLPAKKETKSLSLAPRNFQEALQSAGMYAKSALVPERFRGKVDDCFVAIQLAARQGVDPLMLMQHSYVVHGSPGIEGKYAIALMNAQGPFRGGLNFDYNGEGDTRSCTAWGTHSRTGQRCSARVGMEMVRAEKWDSNPKWKSMTDQMLAYRAGAFLARRYCPEVLMGMQTVEELQDIIEINPVVEPTQPESEPSTIERQLEAAFNRGQGKDFWVLNYKAFKAAFTDEEFALLEKRKNELKLEYPDSAGGPTRGDSPTSAPPLAEQSPDPSAPMPQGGGEPDEAGANPSDPDSSSKGKRGRPRKDAVNPVDLEWKDEPTGLKQAIDDGERDEWWDKNSARLQGVLTNGQIHELEETERQYLKMGE